MAISSSTDSTQLLGIIKATYADKLKDARMSCTVLQDRYKLDGSRAVIGSSFNIPILVTESQSTTYDANQGTKTLTTATAPQSVNAAVVPFETTEVLNIPFGMMAQADLGAKVSFASEQVIKMFSLWKGVRRQAEWTLLYGKSALATIASTDYSSGTTCTLTLTAGTYAPGYLNLAINAPLDSYSAVGGTHRNTNALIRVTGVNTIAGTIAVSGNASDLLATVAGDVLERYGEDGYVFPGIGTQLANTSSTLITGLDPTAYNLIKGNVVTSVGNVGVQKLIKYATYAKDNGLEGLAVCLVPPNIFGALANEMVSARRLDYSYEKGKTDTGAESIMLRAGNIQMEILEHPFVKQGDVFLFGDENIIRPGVSDVTDSLSGQDLSVMSSTTNAYQFRVWTSQAALVTAPAQGFALQGCTVP